MRANKALGVWPHLVLPPLRSTSRWLNRVGDLFTNRRIVRTSCTCRANVATTPPCAHARGVTPTIQALGWLRGGHTNTPRANLNTILHLAYDLGLSFTHHGGSLAITSRFRFAPSRTLPSRSCACAQTKLLKYRVRHLQPNARSRVTECDLGPPPVHLLSSCCSPAVPSLFRSCSAACGLFL